MTKSMSRLVGLGLAAVLALGSAMPTSAAPFAASRSVEAPSTDLVQVQYRRHDRRHMRRDNRRHIRRDDRRDYYRGHRGYRNHRRGYRRHNGYWFPPAAFIAGAIINGATRNSGVSNSHIRSCQSRYRSYRASDNTYQPYNGPRRQCR